MHSRLAEATKLSNDIICGHRDRKGLRDGFSVSTVMGPVNQPTGMSREEAMSLEITRKRFTNQQSEDRTRLMRVLGHPPDTQYQHLLPIQKHMHDAVLRFSTKLAAACTIHEIDNVERRVRHQRDEAQKMLDDEAAKQIRMMKKLEENIAAMDEFWRSVNNTQCGGRIAHAKTVSEYRETFDRRVEQLCTQGRQLDIAEEAMKSVNDTYQNELKVCGGDALRVGSDLTKQVSNVTRALQSMKRVAEDLMAPNHESSDDTKPNQVDLVVPKGLRIRSAGHELSKNFDHYIESHGERYSILHPYAERISRDISPTAGTFYRPPQKGRTHPFSEVPSEIRKRYAEQNEMLYKIWKVKLDDSILNECLQTFTYGTDNEMEAKIQEGDGLGVYWALMSMFRPLSDIWKEDVEKYITDAHRIFTSSSTNMLQEIGKLKDKIGEARLLGIRIKWFTTGKMWYQALSDRPRYNTALQKYHKPKSIDTDDCIMFLEAMVQDIRIIAQEELSSFIAQEELSIVFNDDARGSPSGGQFNHDQEYAAQAEALDDHRHSKTECCFAKGCTGQRPDNYFQFCGECHRTGLNTGSITAKNQKQYLIKSRKESDIAERKKLFDILSQDAKLWRLGESANMAEEGDDEELRQRLQEQSEWANQATVEPPNKKPKNETARSAVEQVKEQEAENWQLRMDSSLLASR